MAGQRTVVWFRRDLRVADNAALAAAAARGGDVVPLFVLDPRLLRGRAPEREAWLFAHLASLAGGIEGVGGRLVLRLGDPREEVPRVAREVGADRVHWNRDYTPFARRRDLAVEGACRDAGFEPVTFADLVLVEPGALRTQAGSPYTVFTPYFRAWSAAPFGTPAAPPERVTLGCAPATVPLPAASWRGELPAAGEVAARGELDAFLRGGLAEYRTTRDRPDLDATSRLSIHLRFGALSPRQVHAAVTRAARRRPRLAASANAFLRQLAWREFFVQILWHAPASRRAAWRADRRGIRWRADRAGLAAWREGRTGYPLVDAGMRELAATGRMHNRVRLVVASFLTKHLLVDWREGDRWFMARLLDGDPALNGGNWQWVAGTGADAMPVFRIFNPTVQGRRFDPDGAYVRRWVPELARVPAAHVHAPWEVGGVVGYPPPLVEHRAARARALAVLAGGATRGSGASAPSDAE